MWLKSVFKKEKKLQESENVDIEQDYDVAVPEEDSFELEADGSESEDAPKHSSSLHKFILWTKNVLSGDILSNKEVKKHYSYVLFLLVLALLYITHIFSVQQLYREHSQLTRDIKDLRAKSLTISSYRMQATRHSNIIKMLEERGSALEESLTPNVVISK